MFVRIAFWISLTAVTMAGGCSRGPAPATSDRPGDASREASHGSSSRATSFYSVADYDPQADPAADLAKTVARASAEGKRIILEIGGQW